MLTQAQVAEFRAKGYLKSGRVLNDAQVDALRNELKRVMDDKDNPAVPQPVGISNWNPKAPIWQIVNIWEASDPFRELLSNPTIVEDVSQLSDCKQLRVWHDQIQYKPAAEGGVNNWHQDAPYWPSIGPKNDQVTAWVALDDVDADNGCMSMVPGSHLWGNKIEYVQAVKDFHNMPKEFEGHQVDVEVRPVKKGEVHYHHSLTWHGSQANTSGRPRRAIAVHYMTQNTINIGGGHCMKKFMNVPEGAMLHGDHFPLVWENGKAIPVAALQQKMAVAK